MNNDATGNIEREGANEHILGVSFFKPTSRKGIYIITRLVSPMPGRMNFKSDESFLEKISIGAKGAQAVFDDLKRKGHNPIELERGSMSFKLWKGTKIKRIRVPDILCVNCGVKVESRAKSDLEISMSHSESDPNRVWDYGLDDSDRVAYVVCRRNGPRPIDCQAETFVQYATIKDMRDAFTAGKTIKTKPKGSQEGSEVRIEWPSKVMSCSGTVLTITDGRMVVERKSDGRKISLKLKTKDIELTPLVRVGDELVDNQVVASVIPIASEFVCGNDAKLRHYIENLKSTSLAERYAAVKALSLLRGDEADKALWDHMDDPKEHIYIRLDAAAALARHGIDEGLSFIQATIDHNVTEARLEAVIILSEIKAVGSCEILRKTLEDKMQHQDVRAGAAWALGEIRCAKAMDSLIASFVGVEDAIRTEAARALSQIARVCSNDVIAEFVDVDEDKRPGVAWAISKAGSIHIDDFVSALVSTDARQWVAYILGTQEQAKIIGDIEELRKKDPEVYFAATVLWKIMSSWVNELEEYG